ARPPGPPGPPPRRSGPVELVVDVRSYRSLEVSRSASSSGGPPNGLADPGPADDPLTEAGLPPGQAAWSPRGAPKPNVRCWRMGRSLHPAPGDHPRGCFDPLVGCSHTATARTEHTESYICSLTLTKQRTVPTPLHPLTTATS